MNAHIPATAYGTTTPALDPVTIALSRYIGANAAWASVYGQLAEGDDEAYALLLEKEMAEANEALKSAEPTSLEGVIATLRYIIEEEENGVDITCFIPMMESAIRGLNKMRRAQS